MTKTAVAQAICPECDEPVKFDGGLWHCDAHGAWDRDALVWVDANGAIVEDPSEYSRRAAAARADQTAAPVADVDAWHARLRGIAAATNRPARPVYGQAGRWS